MTIDDDVERAAQKLRQRYGDQTLPVLEDLLHEVPDENAELLKLLRQIRTAVEKQAARPH